MVLRAWRTNRGAPRPGTSSAPSGTGSSGGYYATQYFAARVCRGEQYTLSDNTAQHSQEEIPPVQCTSWLRTRTGEREKVPTSSGPPIARPCHRLECGVKKTGVANPRKPPHRATAMSGAAASDAEGAPHGGHRCGATRPPRKERLWCRVVLHWANSPPCLLFVSSNRGRRRSWRVSRRSGCALLCWEWEEGGRSRRTGLAGRLFRGCRCQTCISWAWLGLAGVALVRGSRGTKAKEHTIRPRDT